MKKDQSLENYINEATRNIKDDRAATSTLLMNLMKYMQTGNDNDRHRDFGLIAAKYLETLQRSNEQLVKLATILQKNENKSEEITEKDKQDLFDLIKKDN
jgi:hypothetical protein